MGLELQFEQIEDYFLAKVKGEFDLSSAKELTQQIFDTAHEHGMQKVLIDCYAMDGIISFLDRYDYGRFLAHTQIRQCHKTGTITKLAFFGKEPQIDPERLGLMVAQNRGAIATVTTDLKEAIKWLHSWPGD